MGEIRYHRAIWLSDIHLGTRGCKAEFLLDFLRSNESDVLYLVGDIIDGWALKRSWYWDQHHNDVIQKLLRKVRKGTRVYYIPGNHDEFAREYVDTLFGGVTVKSDVIHEMLDGRRLLVMHGDEFDGIIRYARWLAVLGDMSYRFALSDCYCAGDSEARREAVTGAAHGLYEVLLAERLQGLAQPADVDIDSALFDINIGAPDSIEQL